MKLGSLLSQLFFLLLKITLSFGVFCGHLDFVKDLVGILVGIILNLIFILSVCPFNSSSSYKPKLYVQVLHCLEFLLVVFYSGW